MRTSPVQSTSSDQQEADVESSRAYHVVRQSKVDDASPLTGALSYLKPRWIILSYSAVSLSTLLLLFYFSFFASTVDSKDGSPSHPEWLDCRSWAYGDDCGIDGVDCRPFESKWSSFRCPSRCSMSGDSSLVVYGSHPYRADSRLCRAAIHAGVIGSNGGCGLYRFAGPANAFASSEKHGVQTEQVLSWFPKTVEFQAASSSFCTDLSWWILAVSIVLFAGYSLVPQANPLLLFQALLAWGLFYVRLIGQPNSIDYTSTILNSFGESFVVLAVGYTLYNLGPIHVFRDWEALSGKQRLLRWGLCYVLPYHALLHMNMIEYVPWMSLGLGGYAESHANAGTYILYSILGILFLMALAWFIFRIYKASLWKKYTIMYAIVVVSVLLSWALFPSTSFHFHHTMFGAFFLPITRFPTYQSAIAQSALLGCFIQGYAAWGWTSYLEIKPTYLTVPVPEQEPNTTNISSHSVVIEWETLDDVVAYSLKLNNVEKYRGVDANTTLDGLERNMTYYISVAGILEYGATGKYGEIGNFSTLA